MATTITSKKETMNSKKIIPIHGDISPISIFQDTEVIENNQLPVLERYKHLIVDINKKLPPKQVAWSISVNDETFTGGTKGNFSVIIGKAKSKKTGLVSLIVSQYVKDNPGKRVLYFDTEQDEHDAQRVGLRYTEHTKTPEDIILIQLRNESTLERLKIIDEIITETEGVELIVIDGIRDVITSINDEEQATLINTKLLHWTSVKKAHIITIVHMNKGDNNARGHIGTELMNKSELVLSVTKDSDDESKSIVKKELDRSAPKFPDFIIRINESDKIVIDGITSTKKKSENGKLRINDISDITWTTDILPSVFDLDSKLSYANLNRKIKVYLETKFEVVVGDNRVKDFVTNISNKGFIEKIGKDRSKDAHYIFTGL